MKSVMIGVLASLAIGMAGMAKAANEPGLAEALAGKSSTIVLSEADKQIVALNLSPNTNYIIDVKARFCYYSYTIYEGVGSNTHPVYGVRVPLSCQNLKRGFPMIAPLITWND